MKILATVSLLTLIVVFSLPSAHGSELIEDASYFPSHQRDVLSISVPSDSERDAANKIISRDRDLPRYIFFTNNLKLKSYPAKFCGTENVKDCDTAHYAESILLTSGIGFVVAVVSLIMGVVFWAFRYYYFRNEMFVYPLSGVAALVDAVLALAVFVLEMNMIREWARDTQQSMFGWLR